MHATRERDRQPARDRQRLGAEARAADRRARAAPTPSGAVVEEHAILFEGENVPTRIYDRSKLTPGRPHPGPGGRHRVRLDDGGAARLHRRGRHPLQPPHQPRGVSMAATEELRIAAIPTDVEIDPVTLDIIEGALKSARYEMDAVLFRSAMSPVIREQHDEFPMLTDPRGRMVVGQFGAYINEMMADWTRGIYPGDVILCADPFKCSGSISHTNDWLVLVPIFFEDELVGWASQFGHMMDAGGPLPGALPTGAKTIFGEGIIIPPIKIVERGVVQEDVLGLILNNVRIPEMNRADLFAIIAGCRAGEARVMELCTRFGKPTYLAALQALLDRTHEAMRKLILMAIPETPQTFEDWVDDDGLGNGPFKMKLTIWREGEHAYFDWSGTDPQAIGPGELLPLRGHVQDVHRDLPDHGERPADPLQRRLLPAAARRDAGGQPAAAALPGGARLPHARARAALRRARRRALQERSRPQHGGGLRHQPVHALLGLEGVGRRAAARRVLLLDGDPLRRDPGPADRRRHGRPLVVAALREHPDGVPRGLLPDAHRRLHDHPGHGRRGPPPRRQRRREALRLPRAGRGLDPRRPLADAAVGRARRPARARAAASCSCARTAPSRCCRASATRSRYSRATCSSTARPAAAAGRIASTGRPRRSRATSPSGSSRSRARRPTTASCSRPTASVDEAATEAERTRQRSERGDAQAFDFGPSLEETLANCLAETGLEPPKPATPLRWSPLEPGDAALKRVRDADAAAAAGD